MKLLFDLKKFDALCVNELYEVLKLRSQVFVVEQHCVYQDLDGKDALALHLIGKHKETIVAYARLFGAGQYFENLSVGRIVVHPDFRHLGLGHQLLDQAHLELKKRFTEGLVTISAQQYLQNFYERHGYEVSGNAYLEDGIPHLKMNKLL